MERDKATRQIKILNAEVARKIAAGEVIDRPNAIVRELLDNAVDSGADRIDVEIYGGGIDKIRVADNGCGMSKENLLVAAHPHATSKISAEDDLLNLTTLGFRGEALASIAAVSRLTIASGTWKMRCSITEDHIIEPAQSVEGTIVTSENLFENFPARRQFLKRPASETKMCRSTFIEKAMARPDIAFRLSVDGEIRSDLSAGQTLAKRFVSALDIKQSADLFYELKGKSPNDEWSFSLVIGDPSVSRADRKDIYIFVNGRRIAEYSLLQAIEYGAQGCFPNGTHPAAALFVQMRPDLVDFNIHPAKREARFKDIAVLHHGISSTLREFFHAYTTKTMKTAYTPELIINNEVATSSQLIIGSTTNRASTPLTMDRNLGIERGGSYERPPMLKVASPQKDCHDLWSRNDNQFTIQSSRLTTSTPVISTEAEKSSSERTFPAASASSSEHRSFQNINTRNEPSPLPLNPVPCAAGTFRYLACALGTFILIEKNNALYAIDQHAAHERFLFDKIMNGQNQRQNLLVPLKITLDSDEDESLMQSLAPQLAEFGFECEKNAQNEWQFTTLNALWRGGADELKTLLFERGVEPKEIIRKIAAMTACKAAVKDGYILDDAAAEDLAKKALELDDPHCPHGRPVYTVITREKLFELVKRT